MDLVVRVAWREILVMEKEEGRKGNKMMEQVVSIMANVKDDRSMSVLSS